MLEKGEVIDCPECRGTGKINKRSCSVCQGERRVEKQHQHTVQVPAGSWLPTRYRGGTNYLVVLYGPAKQSRTR